MPKPGREDGSAHVWQGGGTSRSLSRLWRERVGVRVAVRLRTTVTRLHRVESVRAKFAGDAR